MEDLYSEIREQSKQDYGQKFEEWAPRILVDQYSDRTHFIFELIQNAEDAGATYVTFSLYPDRLVLCHNGKPFSEADIRGICGIRSTKDDPDSGKIGRFGIGFKSVYAYTKTPRIYSGKYSFRICNLILPYAENDESTGDDTVLVLPFDGTAKPETSYCEIKDALKKYLSPDVLFALCNVRNISCKIYPDENEWSVGKDCTPVGDSVDKVLLTQKPSDSTKELLVFRTQDKQPILIGYEIETDDNGNEQIVPTTQHYLYVFFQTAVETHQAFYIHVPFSTTPARDNIRHNEVNQVLSKNLDALFADSINWLLEHGYVTLRFLNEVYPLDNTCKEENLQGIYHKGCELLKSGIRLLPTDSGGYCSVSEALLPYAKNIAESITEQILKSEYGEDAAWVESEVSSEGNGRLWDYLTHTFGIRVLRWKDVLPQLSADVLEAQSDEWLLHLMEVIYPTCTGNLKLKDKVDAHAIPFVRLQDGSHICCQYDGMAQVYLNNPTSCKNKISTTILQDQRGYQFYVNALGIEEYNAVQELKDDVVCFYGEDSEDTDIPFEDNLEHFELIERALKENSAEVQRILEEVPIIWTTSGWKKPGDCYLPDSMVKRSDQESQMLKGLALSWVSGEYSGHISADTFIKIGCNIQLKSVWTDQKSYLLLISSYNKSFSSEIVDKIFSKQYTEVIEPGVWNWEHSVDHIRELLMDVSLGKSIAIVDFLDGLVEKHPLYGTMRGARDRNYSGKSVATLSGIPSALAAQLEAVEWLYDKNATKREIKSLKLSELHESYTAHGRKLLAQLPFIPENEAVEAAIQSVDSQYQAFISAMLKKPDELRLMCEAYQKLQKKRQKETAKPQSLAELLEKQSSTQTDVEAVPTPDDETLGEYGAVQNLKYREKKLEKNFQEGLEGQKTVAPRLRYTCSESNQEEKAFLRAQYFGKCQICGKQIIRYDGKPYFEACNILPTDSIPTKYKQSISEGWNSLCLCPNCAAEFKYGKKNLSELIKMIQTYQVEEKDENLIVCNIEMQGERRTIKYTGKHFLALQSAIRFYEQDYNSRDRTDTDQADSDD